MPNDLVTPENTITSAPQQGQIITGPTGATWQVILGGRLFNTQTGQISNTATYKNGQVLINNEPLFNADSSGALSPIDSQYGSIQEAIAGYKQANPAPIAPTAATPKTREQIAAGIDRGQYTKTTPGQPAGQVVYSDPRSGQYIALDQNYYNQRSQYSPFNQSKEYTQYLVPDIQRGVRGGDLQRVVQDLTNPDTGSYSQGQLYVGYGAPPTGQPTTSFDQAAYDAAVNQAYQNQSNSTNQQNTLEQQQYQRALDLYNNNNAPVNGVPQYGTTFGNKKYGLLNVGGNSYNVSQSGYLFSPDGQSSGLRVDDNGNVYSLLGDTPQLAYQLPAGYTGSLGSGGISGAVSGQPTTGTNTPSPATIGGTVPSTGFNVQQAATGATNANNSNIGGATPVAPQTAPLTGYNPNAYDYTASPGYQFAFNEGLRALNRGYAAAGQRLSGNRAAGLIQYGQQAATSQYNQDFNRLATLAGFGNAATGSVANAANQVGANNAQILANTGAAQANQINQAGQFNAAGILGNSRALGGTISNLFSGGGIGNFFNNPGASTGGYQSGSGFGISSNYNVPGFGTG